MGLERSMLSNKLNPVIIFMTRTVYRQYRNNKDLSGLISGVALSRLLFPGNTSAQFPNVLECSRFLVLRFSGPCETFSLSRISREKTKFDKT